MDTNLSKHIAPAFTLLVLVRFVVWGCGTASNAGGVESDDRSYTSQSKTSGGKANSGNAQKSTCLNDQAQGCPTPTPTPCTGSACPDAALEPTCTLPAGASNTFTTTLGMMALINAMPKPLSLACFLEVLPNTHQLAGSSSGASVQPAHDVNNPRLFLVIGDMLLGIVPDGPDKDSLEFSMLAGSTESVKGELKFPVTDNLDPVNPFTRIQNSGRPGTTCGLCHVNETDTSAQYGTGSYQSRALRPTAASTISAFELQSQAEKCATDPSNRCRIWRAAYITGKTGLYTFPADMPVLGQP